MKNKPVLISLIAIVLLIGGFFIVKSSSKSQETAVTATSGSVASNTSSAPMSMIPADKIEVVHFHGTQQCVSCITVGKLAKQTIDEKFPEEVKSGKIVFKEINGELPENEVIVTKYQARGSSLFVNSIRGEKDDIKENTTVWRLVGNESQYITYFEKELKTLLGK